MYSVLLKDGTVGKLDTLVAKVGNWVTVDLHDENGLPIQVTGEIEEILEDLTNYLPSLSSRLNLQYGVVENAHVLNNVNTGLAAYDTLCLICAELSVDLSKVDDADFYSCSIGLENFCYATNEDTKYTVSVWFNPIEEQYQYGMV
jgi:hypothetical protein